MNREELEKYLGPPNEFRVRVLGFQATKEAALVVNLDSLKIRTWFDQMGNFVIRGLVSVATQEEEVLDYPADWWQAFKVRWFPKWLQKKFPPVIARVWAVHKFPELKVPNELVGREYVTFRIVNEKLFQ